MSNPQQPKEDTMALVAASWCAASTPTPLVLLPFGERLLALLRSSLHILQYDRNLKPVLCRCVGSTNTPVVLRELREYRRRTEQARVVQTTLLSDGSGLLCLETRPSDKEKEVRFQAHLCFYSASKVRQLATAAGELEPQNHALLRPCAELPLGELTLYRVNILTSFPKLSNERNGEDGDDDEQDDGGQAKRSSSVGATSSTADRTVFFLDKTTTFRTCIEAGYIEKLSTNSPEKLSNTTKSSNGFSHTMVLTHKWSVDIPFRSRCADEVSTSRIIRYRHHASESPHPPLISLEVDLWLSEAGVCYRLNDRNATPKGEYKSPITTDQCTISYYRNSVLKPHLPHTGSTYAIVAISPDGSRLCLARNKMKRIVVLDLVRMRLTHVVRLPLCVVAMRPSNPTDSNRFEVLLRKYQNENSSRTKDDKTETYVLTLLQNGPSRATKKEVEAEPSVEATLRRDKKRDLSSMSNISMRRRQPSEEDFFSFCFVRCSPEHNGYTLKKLKSMEEDKRQPPPPPLRPCIPPYPGWNGASALPSVEWAAAIETLLNL